VVVAALVVVLGPASPALADAARPGDTASSVESVEPAVDGVRLDIVGGDAFVRLRVDRGHEALVPGYEGEPYLRVLADGTVEENRRSPATLLNRTRYGEPAGSGGEDATTVDADAEPDWEVVGDGGEVVWHDHRTHYMGRDRPPTMSGDGLVQQWELPLVVDGVDVVVTGSIHLRDSPSAAWWVVPLVLAGAGLVVVVVGWVGRTAALLPVAVAAAVSGLAVAATSWAAWASLPTAARSAPAATVLGLVALVVGVVAVAVVRAAPWRGVLVAGAGAALVTVAWAERDVLRHAVVPGADPAWPLRLALASALAAGPVALVLGAASVIWLPPTTSPPRSNGMGVMPEPDPSRSGPRK
jgi:hypothetical protein